MMTDEKELMLVEVQDDGLRIALEDGTRWRVNPLHSKAVREWLPTTMVRIELASEAATFPYAVVNIPAGVSVKVAEVN